MIVNNCSQQLRKKQRKQKTKKHVLMQLKPTSAPHVETQKIVPRGPIFFQESPPPFMKQMGEVIPGKIFALWELFSMFKHEARTWV